MGSVMEVFPSSSSPESPGAVSPARAAAVPSVGGDGKRGREGMGTPRAGAHGLLPWSLRQTLNW